MARSTVKRQRRQTRSRAAAVRENFHQVAGAVVFRRDLPQPLQVSMAGTVSYAPLPRGVYIERFTVNGHRWVYSVDARGEQVTLRTPLERDVQATADELWDELDRVDPIPCCDSPTPPYGQLRLT